MKLSDSSEMQNDALLHREGLKGQIAKWNENYKTQWLIYSMSAMYVSVKLNYAYNFFHVEGIKLLS